MEMGFASIKKKSTTEPLGDLFFILLLEAFGKASSFATKHILL